MVHEKVCASKQLKGLSDVSDLLADLQYGRLIGMCMRSHGR